MKKKVTLGKKLAFNKTAIASLNAAELLLVAGGKVPITWRNCNDTLYETCETQPSPIEPCRACMA
ncbi:hypothetical protein ECE50_029120 [Chitinophaga sp. Mgbs1]|uniref:Uncharacterized protein n=1 Tax=Chitinophaga solisilvae TaxID=1233460 RepID=A0A433WKD7_9BACT|nr:hypothetical protein [Chitinophaga solisilvae]